MPHDFSPVIPAERSESRDQSAGESLKAWVPDRLALRAVRDDS